MTFGLSTWLADDSGGRIMSLDPFVSLSASMVVNKIGRFQLSLPTSFDLSVLRRDLVVQVWLTTS